LTAAKENHIDNIRYTQSPQWRA